MFQETKNDDDETTMVFTTTWNPSIRFDNYWHLLGTASENKDELPERYIINKDATILFWKNGEKTIIKRSKNDNFDKRLAFLTAYFQHHCGLSKNKANKYIDDLIIEEK